MSADQWYFSRDELRDTPSISEGLSFEEERMDRTKGCHYLMAVGAKLNLPQLVVVTATTFFHRFYMRRSMKRFHVYDIAATCLFVATKVEDCIQRMMDFVNACAQKAQKNNKIEVSANSKEFTKWKDTMLYNEVILMETLCFDFAVEHPHTKLLEIQSKLQVPPELACIAWMLLYQSLGAPLCVMYRPKVIASAALLLATYFSDKTIHENWLEDTQVDIGLVHELATEMLSYYRKHYKSSSSHSPHHAHPHPKPHPQRTSYTNGC